MDKKKAKNGFTLIEMVVVVAMMGLMVGLGSVYFSRNSNQRAVDETVSKLISQIEIARNNAKIRNSPKGGAESNFRYVKLEVIDGVAIITNSNGYEYSRTPITSAEVSIDNITGCGLCFAAGEGKLIDSSGGFLTDEVTIAISSGDSAKNVIVNTTGLVQKDMTGGVAIPAIQTSTPKAWPTFYVTPILGTPGPTRTPTPVGAATNTPIPLPTATRTPTPVAGSPICTSMGGICVSSYEECVEGNDFPTSDCAYCCLYVVPTATRTLTPTATRTPTPTATRTLTPMAVVPTVTIAPTRTPMPTVPITTINPCPVNCGGWCCQTNCYCGAFVGSCFCYD